jgi:threonine dehydrogenase-like Zn-dependent dehydrogenase
MLAGEIHAPRQIRLIDAPEPKLDIPADGEPGRIIFQPELGCLCGSDLLFFEADYPEFPPVVGHSLHELVGTVVETSGRRFRSGDRVLCIPDDQRGLAQRFAVEETRAILLDTRKPLEQALMAQPLGTVLFALRKMPNVIDLDVVVVGQGPIGQLFCAALRNLGARNIIAVDPLASRLAVSPRMGATTVINAQEEDAPARVAEVTGVKLADLVIEVVGHRAHALNLCIDLCRLGGRILNFGLTEGRVEGIRWLDLHKKNITIHNSIGPDFERDFPLAMRWIGEGRIDVAPIITHRFDLANIQEAFETFRERRDGALKVLITFP